MATPRAIESYDGRNMVTNHKLAYFPASRNNLQNPDGTPFFEDQAVGGATQTEYNSRYLEDPRNDVSGFQYATGSGQGVVNPIVYRFTDPAQGFSMIRNTVVYDHDGTLGHGADVYVCYDDDFFAANATGAGTVPPGGLNLRILPTVLADFAQFEVRTDLSASSYPNLAMTVTVNDHVSGTRSLLLRGLPSNTRDYGFNAPIGLGPVPVVAPNREGIYRCAFGNQVPTAYEIKIQFAEAEGVPTIIGVPLAGSLTGLLMNSTDLHALGPKASLSDLLNAPEPDAWFHDVANSMLYVRTTTVVLGPNALTPDGPDLDGTRNVILVN